MELNWFEAIVYGLISGLSEFLPVSSRAHQAVLRHLFGGGNTNVLDLMIHIAIFAALVLNCQKPIRIINRTNRILSTPRNQRRREPNGQITALIRLLKTACWPVVLAAFLFVITDRISTRFQFLAVCVAANGIVLYISWHCRSANKDARFISSLDSFLVGFASALGIVPGISRIGMGISMLSMRGYDARHAADWAVLISIPAVAALCVSDIILIATGSAGTLSFLLMVKYVISAAFACLGSFLGIRVLKTLTSHRAIGWASYYCWGLAMFSFVLFML